MSEGEQRVAIITGGSQGIGAGLVAGYRRQGWAVVANSRTIKPSQDRDVLTVDGDVSEPTTADRIIGEALKRFGRIDTLINNAGVFIAKPFTDYTAPETFDALAGLHPVGRVGQVSDIVDGILFLESSPFITGEILHIDGGQIAGH